METNFCELWIQIYIFSFMKMHLKMSSVKGCLSSLGLNELTTVKVMTLMSMYIPMFYIIINTYSYPNPFENVSWKMAALIRYEQNIPGNLISITIVVILAASSSATMGSWNTHTHIYIYIFVYIYIHASFFKEVLFRRIYGRRMRLHTIDSTPDSRISIFRKSSIRHQLVYVIDIG